MPYAVCCRTSAGRGRSAPTIRGCRSVPSDVRGPGMERSDGESSQHPAPQEALQGNRHQNRRGIPNGVLRFGNRSGHVSPVGASGIETHESMGSGRGVNRAGGPKRPRNRRGGRVGPVAIPADQHRGAEAVFLNWETWSSRRGLQLTYRMTQMLTGHLMKIRRETTEICHHCGEGRDAAQHTLEFCPAWELSRYTLQHVIGERLTPSVIVEVMLSRLQEYEAVRLFCERVILAKERAESERKSNFHPCRITQWREMAVRRPRATSSPSQRIATRRGDGARGNAPPPCAKFNSQGIFRTGSNKRTREGGATEK